jgi:hypothetical protein
MTASTKDTFQIYDAEFQSGYVETLVQETNAFNAASRNAIRLSTQSLIGDYAKNAFFLSTASLISRRDTGSLAAADQLDLAQDEIASVKINRMIGPVVKTLDALKKIASSQAEFSFVLGQQIAKAVMVDMLNNAIRATVAALVQNTSLLYDYSGTGGMTHSVLATGKGKMGDAASRIICWVMHSAKYNQLELQALTDKITNVADGLINVGKLGALGIPVIITDASPLFVDNTGTDHYYTLGLVADGVQVIESEERTLVTEGPKTEKNNLYYVVQGELAYNLGVKGYTYDYADGGANPTDADVATSAHWDKVASDNKDCAGVIIKSQ